MNIRHFVAILRIGIIGGSSSIRRRRFRIAVTQRQQQLSTGRSRQRRYARLLSSSLLYDYALPLSSVKQNTRLLQWPLQPAAVS
jgi:hypothetical protein